MYRLGWPPRASLPRASLPSSLISACLIALCVSVPVLWQAQAAAEEGCATRGGTTKASQAKWACWCVECMQGWRGAQVAALTECTAVPLKSQPWLNVP